MKIDGNFENKNVKIGFLKKFESMIDGYIGHVAGLSVIVSPVMTAGMVLIFDSESFPEDRSAGVLLIGGEESF